MTDAIAGGLARELGRPVSELRRVAGGDINEAFQAWLDDGSLVFVKTSPDALAGSFAAEAEGLRWLAEPGAIRVPEVLAVVDPPGDGLRLLALRWIEQGRLGPGGEEELGRGLAAVHAAGAPSFGGSAPLRLGALEIPNEPLADWPDFYAQRRLLPLLRTASDRGTADYATVSAIESVCARMHELAGPVEPPARLHGDLWAGNVMADAAGRPQLIDPLAYGGHREVDLAMLRLFGGPSERCFAAYDEAFPLADGYAERVALYQLFPLLVHAVLFGGSYGAQAGRAARSYVRDGPRSLCGGRIQLVSGGSVVSVAVMSPLGTWMSPLPPDSEQRTTGS